MHRGDVLLVLAHSEAGVVCLNALELVLKNVATAISSNDAFSLPKSNLIEELVTADAYLANEQLVDVVGG